MDALISDILKYSKTRFLEMRKREMDLSEIARLVIDELHERELQRELECKITPLLTVLAEPIFICTVLENLLGNAGRYSSKIRSAYIEFGEMPGQTGVFYVKDIGAGFRMAHADKVFQPYQLAHDGTEFSGTGMGLASVPNIIELHGGRIWAEAEVDKGATFFSTPFAGTNSSARRRRV